MSSVVRRDIGNMVHLRPLRGSVRVLQAGGPCREKQAGMQFWEPLQRKAIHLETSGAAGFLMLSMSAQSARKDNMF